jgi:protein arginine N-methyltransferase 1
VAAGFSTEQQLPEGAAAYDMLVHEIIGFIGSDEGAPMVVADAKRRLLRPGAVCIPHSVTTLIAPVAPLGSLSLRDTVASWFLGASTDSAQPGLYDVANFPPSLCLAAPQTFESYDFRSEYALKQEREAIFRIEPPAQGTSQAGGAPNTVRLSGFALWMRLTVDDENTIDALHQKTTWAVVYVKLFAQPTVLRVGDELRVRCQVDASTSSPIYAIEATLPQGRVVREQWSGFSVAF